MNAANANVIRPVSLVAVLSINADCERGHAASNTHIIAVGHIKYNGYPRASPLLLSDYCPFSTLF